ncbi:MAG: FAD-dependent oxidoreductase [Hungatella sp.]
MEIWFTIHLPSVSGSVWMAKNWKFQVANSVRFKTGDSNLLETGQHICADGAMMDSVRVMPACFETGQAAGTASLFFINRLRWHLIWHKRLTWLRRNRF